MANVRSAGCPKRQPNVSLLSSFLQGSLGELQESRGRALGDAPRPSSETLSVIPFGCSSHHCGLIRDPLRHPPGATQAPYVTPESRFPEGARGYRYAFNHERACHLTRHLRWHQLGCVQ